MDPPVFASFSRDYDQTSLFFCLGDKLTLENVKVGTYEAAVKQCGKVLTPRICDDQNTSDIILSLAQELTLESFTFIKVGLRQYSVSKVILECFPLDDVVRLLAKRSLTGTV